MSDTITIHRPLTEQEFNEGCGYVYRGIPLCEDENSTYVYAYGHLHKGKYAAAVNDYDREMAGYVDEPYRASDVRHLWAVTVQPADGPDGWFIAWGDKAQAVLAEHGGDPTKAPVFPVTVIDR